MTRAPSVFSYTNPSGKVVWKVDVQIGTSPNGRPRFKRFTAPTKRAAHQLGQKAQLEAAQGALAPEGRELFGSFALRWLYDSKAPQVRQPTVDDYRYKLEKYIFPVFGSRQLVVISSQDVTAWMRQLHREGKSNYTINGLRQVINAVMKAAVAYGHIAKNPVTNTPGYRKSRRDMVNVKEPWTVDEAQRVLAGVYATEVELFAVLLIYFGLRKSEALGLKWSDFDFKAGYFTINRSIRESSTFQKDGSRKSVVVEGDPKTPSSRRSLALTPQVVEAVMRHRARVAEPQLLEADAWVFVTAKGNVQRPGNLQRMLHRVLDEQGVRRIRIHDIRHTALVMAIETGTPIEAVSQGAGHSRLDTTKSIYAPYSQTLANRFSQAVAGCLSGDRMDSQLQQLLEEDATLPPGTNGGWG